MYSVLLNVLAHFLDAFVTSVSSEVSLRTCLPVHTAAYLEVHSAANSEPKQEAHLINDEWGHSKREATMVGEKEIKNLFSIIDISASNFDKNTSSQ